MKLIPPGVILARITGPAPDETDDRVVGMFCVDAPPDVFRMAADAPVDENGKGRIALRIGREEVLEGIRALEALLALSRKP